MNTTKEAKYLTVEQYARSRQLPCSWVYTQTRLFLASKGKRGVPCRKFGRYTRIPAGTD